MVRASRVILPRIGRSVGSVVGILWTNGVARTVGRGNCSGFSGSVVVVGSSRMVVAGVVFMSSWIVCR